MSQRKVTQEVGGIVDFVTLQQQYAAIDESTQRGLGRLWHSGCHNPAGAAKAVLQNER